MTSLKPHLLHQLLDTMVARKQAYYTNAVANEEPLQDNDTYLWHFTAPKDTCALAVSSLYGCKMMVYLMQKYAYRIDLEKSAYMCSTIKPCIAVASFSNDYYSSSLIQLASQCCRKIKFWDNFHKAAYISSFMEGFSFNTHCYFQVPRFPRYFTVNLSKTNESNSVAQHNAAFKSKTENCWRTVDSDGVYRFLLVSNVKRPVNKNTFSFLDGLKIETLFLCPSPHLFRGPLNSLFLHHLRSNMKSLKRFRCDYKLRVDNANQMLKISEIPDVTFHYLCIPDTFRRAPFEKKLKSVQTNVDSLLQTVRKYRGTVYANCTAVMEVHGIEWQEAVEKIRSVLPDFTFRQKRQAITCNLEMIHNTKKVIFKVVFFDGDHYDGIDKKLYKLAMRKFHRNETMYNIAMDF